MKPTRKIIISILIGLFFMSSYAQELKTKKILNDFYSEIFTIDKKSKIKNGAYVKISLKNKDTLISGTYRDDIKTGIWKFNDANGQPWISYDYNKKILNRLSDQLIKTDSFLIKKDDAFVLEKVDCPPVYLGFKNEFGTLINSDFHIPVEIMQEGTSIFSIASFIVDKNGKMKDFEIVVPSTDELNIRIQNAFKKIDGEWTSAVFRGQPVESKIFVAFDIKPKGAVSTIPEISNAIIVKLEYYGIQYNKSTSTTVSRPAYGSPGPIRKY